ncbi:MAG TPA: hypothetical protein VFW11_03515 [Cyclobacteriaceae bacterium]|nr:hypothetical protein [Cyclobacteriaceae bacterium]
MAQQPVSKADKQPYSLSLTPKLHSTGHSPYSGVYLNHDPNLEIGLSFKYKQMGGFITKNLDFVDVHSPVNYTSIGVYKSFQLSESFKIMPYVGYFFGQSHSFRDDNSDMWSGVVMQLKVNPWLTLDNTALFGNLIKHHTHASVANRVNATALVGKFKLDAYVWYAHSLRAPHFVSASLAITSPDWVITPSISARVQVAMLQQIANKTPEGAIYRGALMSLIIPIDLSTTRD